MLKSLSITTATLAMLAAGLAPSTVSAQGWYGDRYGRAYQTAYDDGYNRGPHYDDRSYYGDGRYYDRGGYRYQRDYRRCNGTTGTIVGAIAGGLLGRTIDTRGDRSLGTILGLGGGALAGRAIERDGCR